VSSWPIGSQCVVCGRVLKNIDGFNAHSRLGQAWCWGHEQNVVNEALGEDVSMHTLFWHAPKYSRSEK
jgi:hypothetical protein